MFRVKIETSNAAFEGDKAGEVASILRKIAHELDGGPFADMTLRDSNGNTVGKAGFGR